MFQAFDQLQIRLPIVLACHPSKLERGWLEVLTKVTYFYSEIEPPAEKLMFSIDAAPAILVKMTIRKIC